MAPADHAMRRSDHDVRADAPARSSRIVHLGRAWLFYWMVPYPNSRYLWPNFQSPLMWDFIAINTYLTGSVTYLYLPMIPDMAVARDKATGWRKKMYRTLALGWRGTEREWVRLEKAISIMALIIIPVAVSVHTIVSWDFAMTVMPMWRSTIFGPYFVVGAIFSGIAALLIAMVLIRKYFKLEYYLLPIHFDNLAKMLFAMSLLWFYFTFTEFLVTWYGNEAAEMPVFWSKISGRFAPLFWLMVVCNFVIPFPILAIKKLRTIPAIFFASCCILAGMWLERFLIIVPTLTHPFLPYNYGTYWPSLTEATIASGTLGLFVLLYCLFAKFSPMISIWELRRGLHGREAVGGIASPGEPRGARVRRYPSWLIKVHEMAQTCLVRFAEHTQARIAVRRLIKDGIDPETMEVMSSQPIHGEPFVPEKKPTKLRTWALSRRRYRSCGRLLARLNHCAELSAGEGRHADRRAVDRRAHHVRNHHARRGAGHAGRAAGRAGAAELQKPALRPERRRGRRRPCGGLSGRLARVGRNGAQRRRATKVNWV